MIVGGHAQARKRPIAAGGSARRRRPRQIAHPAQVIPACGGRPCEPMSAVLLLRLGRVLLAAAAQSETLICADGSMEGCSGHGTCVSAGRACACDPGYEGERCDVWRGVAPAVLAGVRWINCTHGHEAGGRGVGSGQNGAPITARQFCDMRNKSVCEAAGAPTVPPPGWDEICYVKPVKPKSPQAGSNCPLKGFEGVAVVVKGVGGSFCARPCMTAEESSCVGCPDDACQVKNQSTGKCGERKRDTLFWP
eukprot:COSAG01_NODE_4714_length_4796_cov_6.907813_2_plen_250_part_00